MNEGETYRKVSIGNKLTKLFTDNPDYSVANLIHTVMRSKNIRTEEKDSYFMPDEDFLIAVESTIKELKRTENE